MKEIINHYKLKDGITTEDILSELDERNIPHSVNGTYIHPKTKNNLWNVLVDDIEVCIGFPEDLSEWNDEDYVLVLDDSFGQPYTPFYADRKFPYVLNVVGHYNKFMDSLNFLERR